MMMVALIQGTTVNLPSIMFRQMQEVASSRRLCLPYEMALTRVCREFGVPLEGEAFKKLLHTNTYDDWSLHCMGN